MSKEGRRQEAGGTRELLLSQRLNANSFNLRLMGAIAGAASLALYPVVAKAEYPNLVQEEQQDLTPKHSKDAQKLLESNTNLSKDTIDSPLTEQLSVLLEEEIATDTVTDQLCFLSTTRSPAIQPFQPAQDIKLPKGLQKLSQNTSVPPTPPIKILTPNTVVDIPATTVILQFPVGARVELRVNGDLVDPSLVGRTESDANTNLVTQTWYGVSLKEGTNTITTQVIGSSEPPVSVQVVVRGAPTQLKLEAVETRIPADGRSTATIKGELRDENGNRSNRDGVVTLVSTAGEFIGADFKPDQPGFQVEAKKGQFTASVKSSLNAQTVRIRAIANDLEAYTQLQFETALRPSLVTGIIDVRLGARGTDYYSSFREFLPPNKDNSTQLYQFEKRMRQMVKIDRSSIQGM